MNASSKLASPLSAASLLSVIDCSALPVHAFASEICNSVKNNQVVVIKAPTGSGKSTQVGKLLINTGWRVVVTQPRVLAARSLAMRVAEELGEKLGQRVGVRTRQDRVENKNTELLFATDGLALVRELCSARKYNVLVIDEVHEWNLNIEVLVAWSKIQVATDPNFRVVLMSATLDANDLAAYFNHAPVISVPGRQYPVLDQEAGKDLVDDTVKLLQKGHNVLVFQPGKGEISSFVRDLEETGVKAEILPLHGDLSAEDQQRCFASYRRPKCVVATNVAQTSITIPDIDAVVDSGLEKRTETVNGIEGLYLRPISKADSEQRKGRAGRTKPGVYINHCGEEQPSYGLSEIMRTRLDRTVLRLASLGFDATELEFFHQPPREAVRQAKRTLITLGCLTSNNQITDIGRQVMDLPIDVRFARMIVAADKSCIDEILLIAALFESGEITRRKDKDKNDITHLWKALVPKEEKDSDALAQIAVYEKVKDMTPAQMEKNGVHPKSVRRLRENHKALREALKGQIVAQEGKADREHLLTAICAGLIEHVYKREGQYCTDADSDSRMLSQDSVLSYGSAGLVVGVPFDIEFTGRYGEKKQLHLLSFVTRVTPEILMKVAKIDVRDGELSFDTGMDSVVGEQIKSFNGLTIERTTVPASDHPHAAAVFANWLAADLNSYFSSSWPDNVADKLKATYAQYERTSLYGTRVLPGTRPELRDWIEKKLEGKKCLAEVDWTAFRLEPLDPKLVESSKPKRSSFWEDDIIQRSPLDRDPYSPYSGYRSKEQPRSFGNSSVFDNPLFSSLRNTEPVSVTRGPTSFTNEGKRWFRCTSCSATQRVTKEQVQALPVTLTCMCGKSGETV